MEKTMNPENNVTHYEVISDTVSQPHKEKHFIEDHHFERLQTIRNEVYQATEVNITLRKLVNLIIEQADLKSICNQLIKQYQ